MGEASAVRRSFDFERDASGTSKRGFSRYGVLYVYGCMFLKCIWSFTPPALACNVGLAGRGTWTWTWKA